MSTRLTRGYGFFVVLGLLTGALTAAPTVAPETPVDGVSAMDVLRQVEANQADQDTIHMVVETDGTVLSGPLAGKVLPSETQEMLVFTDPADGHRKVKITSKGGPFPVMYRVDLETYTMEVLMDSGRIERTEFAAPQKAMIEQMLSTTAPSMASDVAQDYVVERVPEADSDLADHLPEPTLAKGQADMLPEEAIAAAEPSSGTAKVKKGKQQKHWLKRLNRKHRGRLKTWTGKRLRTVRLKPQNPKATGPSKGFAAMEQTVDLATGLPLETKLYDDSGKAFLKTRVLKTRKRADGVTEAEETQSDSDGAGARVVVRQRVKTDGAAIGNGDLR